MRSSWAAFHGISLKIPWFTSFVPFRVGWGNFRHTQVISPKKLMKIMILMTKNIPQFFQSHIDKPKCHCVELHHPILSGFTLCKNSPTNYGHFGNDEPRLVFNHHFRWQVNISHWNSPMLFIFIVLSHYDRYLYQYYLIVILG